MTATSGRAIDFKVATTLPRVFYEQAAALDERPFLWRKTDTVWHPLSWREVAAQVDALANGLAAQGIGPGDRVMIVAENRPEWLIADVATMVLGAMTVPAYTTNTVADHLHVLNDSEAKAVIVSTRQLAKRVFGAAGQARIAPLVVTMDDQALAQNPGVETITWDGLLAVGADQPRPTRWETASADDVACIIYTSGTGGAPKGVMLSHRNILTNCMGAFDVLETLGLGDEVFLSFLPLSHSYEHSAGQFFPMTIGAQIYYAEGIDKLSDNFQEVRPTITTAVPRLYEFMRGRILRVMEKEEGLKKKLFFKALELGGKRHEGCRLGLWERLLNWLLDRLVRRKVAGRFGGRLKALVSGGAPLNYDVGLFFMALKVPILQGYGQTEAAPVISVNRPGKVRLDSVGPPLKEVEVRFADDGEILVRGPLVMRGYWNDHAATARAIDGDGWLHTGDIGHLDDEGNIVITDRKKDIIVNSGGDNVAPQRVEGFLTLEAEIAQAMVYGDRRPHLVALLVPDPDWVKVWARKHERDPADPAIHAEPEFLAAMDAAVGRVNRNLSNIEKIRRFCVAPEPFTVENGMLTPTLKIRRHVIRAAYGEMLDGLYEK